jgi:L-ascorbate metabolism protein UlaG (beta-lactamase superfamily)
MAVISHLHPDHFDPIAQELLAKDIPIFCQPGDEVQIRTSGFQAVTPVAQSVHWQSMTLTRIAGQHGSGIWAEQMGNVAGFVFQAEQEPTLYWAGDTVWCEPAKQAIINYKPEVIVIHSSGANFSESGPIIMDAEQTIAVCRAAPQAIVIATHMETFDFDTVSRAGLRAVAEAADIRPDQLLIPTDGQILTF